MTRRSLSESLLELGVSQRFIDEVVAPIMWVNYGQNVSMPAFVGRYIRCSVDHLHHMQYGGVSRRQGACRRSVAT